MEYFKICDKSSGREYDIFPGTSILVNAWESEETPEAGRTRRVLKIVRLSLMGSILSNCHLGLEKRICSGANMGVITAEFTLANMVNCFD